MSQQAGNAHRQNGRQNLAEQARGRKSARGRAARAATNAGSSRWRRAGRGSSRNGARARPNVRTGSRSSERQTQARRTRRRMQKPVVKGQQNVGEPGRWRRGNRKLYHPSGGAARVESGPERASPSRNNQQNSITGRRNPNGERRWRGARGGNRRAGQAATDLRVQIKT